eukprot:12486077-Prorocentrum_lima.AAC.1
MTTRRRTASAKSDSSTEQARESSESAEAPWSSQEMRVLRKRPNTTTRMTQEVSDQALSGCLS